MFKVYEQIFLYLVQRNVVAIWKQWRPISTQLFHWYEGVWSVQSWRTNTDVNQRDHELRNVVTSKNGVYVCSPVCLAQQVFQWQNS